MEICDRGGSLQTTERGQSRFVATKGGSNYLVFRALCVEHGEEELAVSVLALGELESGEDLPERWRCRLRGEEGQHTKRRERGKERDGYLFEDSPGGIDEVVGVGGRVHGEGGGRVRGGGSGISGLPGFQL
jgi:hypothetical protein